MRFELAGSLVHPDPVVITFGMNQNFVPEDYIRLGYTNFDVICIGGGGGMGGGINTENSGNQMRSTGGAGGGGGLHRVQGLLSALSDSCAVIVGSGGNIGIEDLSNPGNTTDGGDGGYSSFNGDTCQASGGQGGRRVQTNSFTEGTLATGGEGGIGGSTISGGGGLGGTAGIPTVNGPGTPGTPGEDGDWNGTIGAGGGGGAGGVNKYGSPPITCNAATAGGRGSYNPGDLSVYGPGSDPGMDDASGATAGMPGGASGAKAAPLNGLPYIYGQSKSHHAPGDPGIVIMRIISQ